MLCQKCQTENSEEAKFCAKCGTILSVSSITDQKNHLNPLIIVTGILFLLGISIFLAINWLNKQKQSSPARTINQVASSPRPKSGFLTPASSPITSLPSNSKYNLDSDTDSIPDFVETSIKYNPNQDECLITSCNQENPSTTSAKQTNILFILDSSGSMAERAGKEIKMDAAKKALKSLLATVPKNVNVGLLVYGQKGSNSLSDKSISCSGIELIYPLNKPDTVSFNLAVDSFKPTGWTAIAGSLQKAKEVFSQKAGQNNMVFLITDGLETCDGNAATAINQLRVLDIKPVVNIVGFGVNQQESSVLQQLSQLGGGSYFQATDSDKFYEIFNNFKKSLAALSCNQNNSQTFINCVAARADKATSYLTNLNQSLYLNNKAYNGVTAGSDDTHEAINNLMTQIANYKNRAGDNFSQILKDNSQFFGSAYQEFQKK